MRSARTQRSVAGWEQVVRVAPWLPHGEESPVARGDQNASVISRAATVGLGALYVGAWAVSSLVLKTTPSDLDLYFWPSAETIVSGHPLLIYAAHVHDVY